MTQTPAELTTRLVEEVLNGRNLAALDELVAEDYEEFDPSPGQAPGREGLKQLFGMLFVAFSDLHWVILEQISEGNKVMTRCIWTGTHDGNLMEMPPTGKRVEVQAITIDEYEDGKMVRSRFLQDDLTMQRQLGLIPQPASA